MTLVVDASVVVPTCATGTSFEYLEDPNLVAPPFMWAESLSALHEAVWRGDMDPVVGADARQHLDAAPIELKRPRALRREAWRLADELGWAKTYDAEYLALAQLLGCRFVTLDARLRRGADRLGFVVSPSEL